MSHPTEHRANAPTLKITEIFFSLQGEARDVGWPTVFVRLTGCPLRCGYCDTAYAFHGGETKSIADILAEVSRHKARRVCVTGGEPLAQKNCLVLLQQLCDAGYEVSLETSGALDVSAVDPRVIKVMDIKTPGSGEEARNRWANIDALTAQDQVKFVLADRADYDWAKRQVAERTLHQKADILFSPVFGGMTAKELAEWILEDQLPVRMQIQLHKYIWGDEPGH